jgi:hypothetical protein
VKITQIEAIPFAIPYVKALRFVFGAAYQLTSRYAGELSNFLDMRDDLLIEPLQIRDGLLYRPAGVGLGVQIDADKLGRYRGRSLIRPETPMRRTKMTTFEAPIDQPTAAASGASAIHPSHADKSPLEAAKETPAARPDGSHRPVFNFVPDPLRN